MKIHEYQGKQIFKKYGVPVPRGIVGQDAGGGREGRPRAGHEDHRGQGAGPRRWPRQGGRREDRQVSGRGEGARLEDPGDDAQVSPDRPRGAAGEDAVHRGRARHREGVLPRSHPRSRQLAHHLHGVHRGRRGDRRSGRQAPREDPPRGGGPGGRLPGVPGPQAGLRAGPDRRLGGQVREVLRGALHGVRRDRRGAGRDQPAGEAQERRHRRARLEDDLR